MRSVAEIGVGFTLYTRHQQSANRENARQSEEGLCLLASKACAQILLICSFSHIFSLASAKMNQRFWRWIKILLFIIPLVYAGYLIRNQVLFQRFLKSLYITFEDFNDEYSKALIAAASEKKPIEFDDYPSLDTLNSTSNIPPKIHFIWFKDLYNAHLDVSEIPHVGSKAPDLCRESNPSFDIHIWNATEAHALLEEHYSWFFPTYDGYKYPIQRVDAFKYFVLWHHGGIYMDLDISCRRSLIPLLDYPAWFPEASPLGVNNDLMASRGGHPVIGKMTKTLKSRDKNLLFPYLTIFWTTGPQFTSDVLHTWWNGYTGKHYEKGTNKKDQGEFIAVGTNGFLATQFAHSLADSDWFYVLPQEFYSEKYTFFGHSSGGTWHGQDVAVVLWLVDRPWVVALVATALILSCVVGGLRWRKHKRRGYKYVEY